MEPDLRTDLRDITRNSDKFLTQVFASIDNSTREVEWLVFGEAKVRKLGPHGFGDLWRLSAYLVGGATDFEHDSAYAFRLPLIAVELNGVENGATLISAVVDPASKDEFHVPVTGYNPLALAKPCEACCDGPDGHLVVPEDYYVPPFNAELWDAVKGTRVRIRIGLCQSEED